jgi:Flp pilus assembly protein TadD
MPLSFDRLVGAVAFAFAVAGFGATGSAVAQQSQDPFSNSGVQVIDSSASGSPAPAAAVPAAPAVPAVKPAAVAPGSQRLRDRYRKVLTAWVAGDLAQAPDDLIQLETSAVSDGDPKSRRVLLQEEQAVIHELGATSLEVLVPIAMLHHEVYLRYLDRGTRGNALAMVHARSMARDLAILYNQQSGSEGSAVVASRLLTSLGGMLLMHAQQVPAAELFYEALQLDGRNLPARLALASIYEKGGQPESAAKTLRELLAVNPEHAEARFRLAMNLDRMGKRGDARKLLDALVASHDTSWVTPLAYEELGRMDSQDGDYAAAEKILRAGIERFQRNARMRIQLAAVLDRRGTRGEARSLVEEAIALAGTEGTERYDYNSVRPDAFAEARAILTDNARSRLSVLAQALGTRIQTGEAGR